MNQKMNPSSLAERLVDTQPESFSLRDIVSKIFLRPKLFALALLIPTLIATTMSAMVPVEWTASTKILIRYSAADAGFLKNIVSEGGLGLSGATSAELMKSTPVLERTIDHVGIKEEDVYKSANRLIADKVFGAIRSFFNIFHSASDDEPKLSKQAQTAIDRAGLISSFKDSLESKSKKAGKGQSIEILEKTSQVPEALKMDELITVEVKSFNREKVDDMANGMADAFIEEYYSLYTEQAKRQTEYVDGLIVKEEGELKRIEQATPASLANNSAQTNSSGRELIARDVPILASLATELSVAEAALTRAQQVYSQSSPQVSRLSNQVANLKFMLKKQERIEISKQLIEQLKAKRFQAQNAENIYKNKLVPINIIERANEPGKSSSKKIMRVLVSAVIGLVLGSILAVGLMVILNVIDPRIHFKGEIEQLLSIPIVGLLPKIHARGTNNPQAIRNNEPINQGIWQLITRVCERADQGRGKIMVISSATDQDGASFCSMALALNLAKNKQYKVCLIDANLHDAGLTKFFKLDRKAGLIEAIVDGGAHAFEPSMEDGRLLVLGTGNLAKRTELGHYAPAAKQLIERLQSDYDFILIDAGATLKTNESLVFGRIADDLLLVVSSGQTRKNTLSAAVRKLQDEGLKIHGILFNRSRAILPEAIYRLL